MIGENEWGRSERRVQKAVMGEVQFVGDIKAVGIEIEGAEPCCRG